MVFNIIILLFYFNLKKLKFQSIKLSFFDIPVKLVKQN
jgi:hypothetical protein